MKIRVKSLLVLPAFIAAFLLQSASHAMGPFFRHVDFIMIACVFALLKDRETSSFLFAGFAYLLEEAIVMPFSGLSLFPSAAALASAMFMSWALYRDNYSTKVFILAIACVIKAVVYMLSVIFFYWGGKIVFLNPEPFLTAGATAAMGAALYGAVGIKFPGRFSWLKTKSAAK